MRQVTRSRNLMVITLTQSLFMFTASLWWPYWSLYIMELGATPTLLGLIFMAESAAQLVFQLPGGYLTDRLGRKKVILMGSVLRAVSPVIYVLTGSWQLVLLGMFFTQASNMMIPAIDALIAESVTKENRGVGYGAFRLMVILPQIFTAYLGGVITDALGVVPGVKLAIAATLIVSWFNVLVRWRYLEDSYVPGESRTTSVSWLQALRGARGLPKGIWILSVVAALSALAFRLSGQFMVVYATRVLGLSNTEWGLITMVVGLVTALLTIPASLLSDRIGRKPGIMVSLGLSAAQFVGFPLSGGYVGVFATRVLGGVSEGFGGAVHGIEGGSAWLALVADITPAGQRGTVMGVIGTVAGLLSLPGSSLGGYMYDSVSPGLPFYAAGASAVAAFLVFTLLVREPEKKAD